MPFLRIEKKKSGTYLRIIESYRNDDGKPTHRTLHSLGKVEDYSASQLRKIGIKLFELGGGELKGLFKGDLIEIGRYNYGYQQIYTKAIQHYGIHHLISRIQRSSRVKFDIYHSLLLMLIERLQEPSSKLKNYEHQYEYINLPKIELQHIYRTLDKLADKQELIQKQIYHTGRDLFNSSLDVVFYDVTTFYFASEKEQDGELRQLGFGKDGKIGKTQVLFSMMIDKNKNPIGYKVFSGNTYEGHTFEEALKDLKSRYQIDKVVIVADRGMLSKSNIELTVENGYNFIIGERIKSLPKSIQKILLDKSMYTGEWTYSDNEGKKVHVVYTTIQYEGKTIISTYSDKRAKKDKNDRDKRIEKAHKLLANPSRLKNKPRRFYIKSNTENAYELDEEKIKQSEKYDGLIAISTNAEISPLQALDQYKQLYKIEHSFRTFKNHLEVRPMFHWTDKRIQGHICLCYLAYTLQNWVLQKINTDKTAISEHQLRSILNKMQLSLIENEGKRIYLRSKQQDSEIHIQRKLEIKQLSPMFDESTLKF
jgi:transposase